MIKAANYDFLSWNEQFPKKVRLEELLVGTYWDMAFGKYFAEELRTLNENLTIKLKEKETIFPLPDLVFRALDKAPDRTSVLIVGQDPYHDTYEVNGKQVPQAMGLCFSTPVGIPTPSSLRNIYKYGIHHHQLNKKPEHGELSFWSHQGCCMLNTALTVKAHEANSHAKIWKPFTDKLITHITNEMDDGVIVLWGKHAINKLSLIDLPIQGNNGHYILGSSHPCGMSVTRPVSYKLNDKIVSYPSFASLDQFGTINSVLIEKEKIPITWKLPSLI